MIPAANLARINRGQQRLASSSEVPALRRELKLLQVELQQSHAVELMLRAEIDLLRAVKEDSRETLLAFIAEVEQLREGRDHWQREANRLRALMIRRNSRWTLPWSRKAGILSRAA
jgi:hypothetical protein